MFSSLHHAYESLTQNARLWIGSQQKGQLESYRSLKNVLEHILTFAHRYEAKNLVSTQHFSDQKLQILAKEFKAIYLVERRSQKRPESEKKKPSLLKKHLIDGRAQRCFILDIQDIGKVIEKLGAPAVIRLSQTEELTAQLEAIAASKQRHSVMIDLNPETQPEEFEALLKSAKDRLSGYYFDRDEQRLYCHPY